MNGTIKALALAKALPHVAKEESRPIMCCVLLRRDGVLVASDGHTMVAYRNAHDLTTDTLLEGSRELLSLANKVSGIKARRPDADLGLAVEIGETGLAEVRFGPTAIGVAVLRGEVYPHHSMLFPQDLKPIDEIGIDPKLLAKFGEQVWLYFTGTERAVVVRTADPDFIGLLMPCRVVDHESAYTDWIKEPIDAQIAKVA